MSSSTFLAVSAFGLGLALAPGAVAAQTAQPPNAEVTLFVPLVDACVAQPTEETCQQVRAVVTECALEFTEDQCGVLLSEPAMVFNNPSERDAAQSILSVTAEAIAGLTFADAEQGALEDASRADAERTLLRGDANLMAHSAPPVLDGEGTAEDAVQTDAAPTPPVAD